MSKRQNLNGIAGALWAAFLVFFALPGAVFGLAAAGSTVGLGVSVMGLPGWATALYLPCLACACCVKALGDVHEVAWHHLLGAFGVAPLAAMGVGLAPPDMRGPLSQMQADGALVLAWLGFVVAPLVSCLGVTGFYAASWLRRFRRQHGSDEPALSKPDGIVTPHQPLVLDETFEQRFARQRRERERRLALRPSADDGR